MKECSKSITRRLNDSNFVRKYFVGDGVDIGGKPDPLSLYIEFFPLIESVKTWDWEDGDAQFMQGVPDESFNFVHSSHCLEHLNDPFEGLHNWLRILKPNGHLIITVPDEDLYEQGIFPSTFNRDHKVSFTIYKPESWCEKSINVIDMVRSLGPTAELLKVELIATNYRFTLPRYDQTSTPVGECAIELIIRKRTLDEIQNKGRWERAIEQPHRDVRIHLNQYTLDMQNMKKFSREVPPFEDDSLIKL
jgi:SAM-dependent methyltransferase